MKAISILHNLINLFVSDVEKRPLTADAGGLRRKDQRVVRLDRRPRLNEKMGRSHKRSYSAGTYYCMNRWKYVCKTYLQSTIP